MNDDEFLKKAQEEGVLKWVDDNCWSGYHLKNTCLILRMSERKNYYTDKFNWYLATKAFNIVLKTIEEDKLAAEWPEDLAALSAAGAEANARFRDTPDF